MSIQWPLLVFSLLAGSGGALLAFTGVAEATGVAKKTRNAAVACALVLLVVGGCASVVHLAQPANIMAAAANVFSFSGISVELIMLGVNVIVGVAYLIASRKEASSSVMRGIAVVGVIAGVVMTFVVGNGYVMQSQPNWNTALLPLAYTGSGLACGGALYCAIMAAFKEDIAEFKLVGVVAIVAIVIQLAACAAYGAVVASAIDAALYWGGCVGVGSVVALACAIFARKTPLAWWAVFAAALVGGIALRAAMWLAGTGFIDMFSLAAGRAVLGV